jgi:Ni2+-binding GTPase involved in maturation of urease and hydrogenase
MATIVVGGSGRGVGKTALVCGLLAALPEFRWTVVKITHHVHEQPQPVWEETEPGQGNDTARCLAAGAERALMVTAGPEELEQIVQPLLQSLQKQQKNLILESNSILRILKPDLCLSVDGGADAVHKASFDIVMERADALVRLADRDGMVEDMRPLFQLAAMERISPEMLDWLRGKLCP